jgi:hypothetical protein
MSDAHIPPEAAAWSEFCRRIEAVGTQLLGAEFPQSAADRAEGFRHLAEQAVCWLGWSLGHGDPRAPFFQRQNDYFTQWGGPNAENVYHHARVDPSLRYRIVGRMNSCDDFILAIRAGFMHQEKWGTLVEVTASDIGIGRGDEFELILGGPSTDDPRQIDLQPDAVMASFREYYFDWRPDEPAVMAIECLDAGGPPMRVTGAQVADAFLDAASATEHSISYWNAYMRDYRAKGQDNTFGETVKVAKGLDSARYTFCFFSLGPDEAMVIETELPDARYWSLQLYTLAWFEAPGVGFRTTNVNHHQAVTSSDGRVRAVLAHEDPGVPNWIDTQGRAEGLVTLRSFWVSTEPPTPRTRVVKLADVREALLADTRTVTPEQRAAELAARRAHIAWRFRA